MSARTHTIIKNTGFLYLRMLFTLLVALYTARVLLATLGTDDYGLYHVVASFILFAGFLQSSLSSTSQRFLAYELGQARPQLQQLFSMSVNIHLLFAVLLSALIGVLGYVLIPALLTYDAARGEALLQLFWLSLAAFAVNILVVPNHAMLIAHERMRAFAWISMLDVALKLVIVLLLPHQPYDPLVAYGALYLLVTLLTGTLYIAYVAVQFPQQRYRPHWQSVLFRRMLAFSGWTLWGNAASVFASHGSNLLLNVFFGPAINAAKSIGSQASGALNQFVSNLQLAMNPQLIKSYASDDRDYTEKLMHYGSKYNFFLLLMLALPLLLRTEQVLQLWLVEPPAYAAVFLQLMLVNLLLDSLSKPLMTAAQATGKIRGYQMVVGGILLLNLPVAYVVLSLGYGAASVFVVAIVLTLCASIARIFMLKRIMAFSFRLFCRQALGRIVLVCVVAVALCWGLSANYSSAASWWSVLSFSGLAALCTLGSVWLLGLEARERRNCVQALRTFLQQRTQRKS